MFERFIKCFHWSAMGRLGTAVLVLLGVGAMHNAQAQSTEEFYSKNKQITMIVGYEPGGTYDAYARFIMTYLPKVIPGSPNIIIRNMPGAGSLRAANYLYSQAPRDGSTIGAISQALVLSQAFKYPGVEFDLGEFGWIGRLATSVELTVAWHTSPVKTIEDVKQRELIIGAASAGGSSAGLPRAMNAIVGTKFKIVPGYGGMPSIALAIERGELEGGHATVNSLQHDRTEWLTAKKVSLLVQYSEERHPDLPNVPAMVEFARTPEEKQMLAVFGSMADIGRTVVAPPGLPADRLAALRRAFDAMLVMPEFLADIKRANIEFQPQSGEALQRRIQSTMDIPPELAARAARAWGGKE